MSADGPSADPLFPSLGRFYSVYEISPDDHARAVKNACRCSLIRQVRADHVAAVQAARDEALADIYRVVEHLPRPGVVHDDWVFVRQVLDAIAALRKPVQPCPECGGPPEAPRGVSDGRDGGDLCANIWHVRAVQP